MPILGLLAFIVINVILYYFETPGKKVKSEEISGKDSKYYTEEFYRNLKKRYENRYESKLDGRFEITLEVT